MILALHHPLDFTFNFLQFFLFCPTLCWRVCCTCGEWNLYKRITNWSFYCLPLIASSRYNSIAQTGCSDETNEGEDEANLAKRRLAVLLLIHGHSLLWGSGNPYDGSILAFSQELIVVTVNYRLGAFGKWKLVRHNRRVHRVDQWFTFGFWRVKAPVKVTIYDSSPPPAVPVGWGEMQVSEQIAFFSSVFRTGFLSISSADRTRGNFGLFDVIAVLQWIRDNIRAFGGDPDRVTIAGHGLGAEFVNLLLLSPLARGNLHIFHI